MFEHGGTSEPVSRRIIISKCTGNEAIRHRKSRDVLINQSSDVLINQSIRFDFSASTPAASPLGRGAEHLGGDGEEQRRIELKKFSLRPEKYNGKGDLEGWVNQFEEYSTMRQWNEEEKASLLFLSLTAGARMYFVGLPE